MLEKFSFFDILINETGYALVAQLDRAFGYEPKGRGFESLQARIKELSKESFFIGLIHTKGLL